MALTAAVLTSGSDTIDATSKTTASFTTNAARLTLAWIENTKPTTPAFPTPDLPTILDGARTWVQVATVVFNTIASPDGRLTCFRCVTTATGALTFDFGGATQTGFLYSIEEYTDVNVASPVRQAVTGAHDGTAAFAITLAAFGSVNNGVAAAVGKAPLTGAITPGTGFTELTELSMASPSRRLETQWRATNATTVDWTWSAAQQCAGIALEIVAAVVGPQTVEAPAVVATWVVPAATGTGSGTIVLTVSPVTAMWAVPSLASIFGSILKAEAVVAEWIVPESQAYRFPLLGDPLASRTSLVLPELRTGVVVAQSRTALALE